MVATAERGQLTKREREVVALLTEGLTNRAIAERLRISEHTARAHMRSIMEKLRVENRTQAAMWAMRHGG